MRKFIFILFFVLLFIGTLVSLYGLDGERTTYSRLRDALSTCPLTEYTDSEFGYKMTCPSFFRRESTDSSTDSIRARFSFREDVNIVLQNYIVTNYHAKNSRSSFIQSGPLMEHGHRVDGYSHYDKCIVSGRMLFVYSLIYPDSYKPALKRLFNIIDRWQVVGAYWQNR